MTDARSFSMKDASNPQPATEKTPYHLISSSPVIGYTPDPDATSFESKIEMGEETILLADRRPIMFHSRTKTVNRSLKMKLDNIEHDRHSGNQTSVFRIGVACVGHEMALKSWLKHIQKTRSGSQAILLPGEDVLYIRMAASDVVLPSARPRHSLFSSLHKAYTPVKPSTPNESALSVQYDGGINASSDLTVTEYALSKIAHLFCFKSGVIVSWGINSAQQEVFLEECTPYSNHEIISKDEAQDDSFGFFYASSEEEAAKEPLWCNGSVQLVHRDSHSDTMTLDESVVEKLAVSYALAQRNLYANFDAVCTRALIEANPTRQKVAGGGTIASMKLNHYGLNTLLRRLQGIRTSLRMHEWVEGTNLDTFTVYGVGGAAGFGVQPHCTANFPPYFLSRPTSEETLFLQTQLHLGTSYTAQWLEKRIATVSEVIDIFVRESHIHRLERLLWAALALVFLSSIFVFLSVFFYPMF